MSIESITKRIKDEADAYAKKQISAAEKQKKEILKEAEKQADEIKAKAKARSEKDGKTLIERRESVAGLESRKLQLQAKQDVIAESFELALEKLLDMSEKDYLTFIEGQLKEFKGQSGEIMLNEKDGKKLASKLSKLVDKKLKVSSDPVNIKGGFILKQGDITINCSLEKLLEDKKEELTSEIASELFPAK